MTNGFQTNTTSVNKVFTKEEFAQKKKEEREGIYKLLDDTAVVIVNNPVKFQEYLDTQSRMDRYSVNNGLLLYAQMPMATRVKEFEGWKKENVMINKGARSVAILDPVEYTRSDGTRAISCNVKKVFDVSQTNGRKAPAITANKDPKKIITAMLDVCPVKVDALDELPISYNAAFYSNEQQTLYVKRGVGDSVVVAQSIAVELAHAQLSIDSDRYSRKDTEFNAKCIAYMLCKKYGIDTKNLEVDSIPDDLKRMNPKEIRKELGKVRNAMEKIHTCVSRKLYEKKMERSQEYDR